MMVHRHVALAVALAAAIAAAACAPATAWSSNSTMRFFGPSYFNASIGGCGNATAQIMEWNAIMYARMWPADVCVDVVTGADSTQASIFVDCAAGRYFSYPRRGCNGTLTTNITTNTCELSGRSWIRMACSADAVAVSSVIVMQPSPAASCAEIAAKTKAAGSPMYLVAGSCDHVGEGVYAKATLGGDRLRAPWVLVSVFSDAACVTSTGVATNMTLSPRAYAHEDETTKTCLDISTSPLARVIARSIWGSESGDSVSFSLYWSAVAPPNGGGGAPTAAPVPSSASLTSTVVVVVAAVVVAVALFVGFGA